MIYTLGIGPGNEADVAAAMRAVEEQLGQQAGSREEAYLAIQRTELKTIAAVNMGRRAMRRPGITPEAVADLSRRVTELETNKVALRKARELVLETAIQEGDAWPSGPIPPVGLHALGNPLAVIPIGVLYLLAGAVVVASVAALLSQLGGVQAFVDAQEDAFEAFSECIDRDGGAQCDQILKLAAQTGKEITQVRKAEETKSITTALMVGIVVVGALVLYRRK